MREEYCPRDEIQKLENEYYNLKMEGSEIEAYTKRSHELANMCPNLSRPPPRRIELYIKGLAPSVESLVTAANLNNLPQIIHLAHKITDQEVECGSLPPRVSATPTVTTTPAGDNKRKWNDPDKATSASQSHKRPDNNNNRSFSQSSSVNQGQSSNPSQGSYLNQNANDNNNRQNNNHNAGNNNNGNNGGNSSRGRVFTIGAGDARNDDNVVTGTFSVNNLFASLLFDSGADWSYVSLEFSQRLGLTPTPLEAKHVVELADVFDIDLLPVTLGSFDVVVGMDWLSKHRADILCKEKIVRIPLPSGESLSVEGHRNCAMVGIISAMTAQKCLRKGYPAILALFTDPQPEERKIEDLPVIREFSVVFPEELPGLPPHHQVEF
ncbi:hybrid signal transduction protein dokA-like [Helianthus annuus]|uniref:hybrid signal transduction protein dokA-like n=1 Tax=Helianthus annuus TaxID=4232 RepID=UPI000B8F3158|nr:hybrid signal transduction protein dokA-like [Helianthus annuus]